MSLANVTMSHIIVPDSSVYSGVDPGMWGFRVLASKVQPPLRQGERLLVLARLKHHSAEEFAL